jgi:hypothetical protein
VGQRRRIATLSEEVSMKKAIVFGLALSFALLGRGTAQEKFDHSGFDALLAKHVAKGRVEYAAWKAKDQNQLLIYLNKVGHADPKRLKPASERLAFFLNTYNALVIAQILENYPLKSPRDVKGFNDRLKHLVGGEPYTLDDLEKKIRTDFPDPRIFFVLNAGATGYPPLAPRAFRGDSLGAQLDSAQAAFLRDPKNVLLDKKAKVLYVSRLFEWHQKEFEATTGSVRTFLKLNLPEEFQKEMESEPYELKYLTFDWSLNGK